MPRCTFANSLFKTSCSAAVAAMALGGGVAAQSLPFQITEVATLANPWGMVFLPDGRAIVTQKSGDMRILRTNGQLSAPMSGVPPVVFEGNLGLLDVVAARSFPSSGRIFFTYMERTSGNLSRLVLAEARVVNESLTNVTTRWVAAPATTGGHPGGRIVLTPDVSLYVTTGDRQQLTPAQDRSQTWGKIVRVDRMGAPRPDNPFISTPGTNPAIWSLGHRNPYGLAWDLDRRLLWSTEMGPSGGDELNVVSRGANYGWPEVSEGNHYDGRPIPRHSTRPEFRAPAYSWTHTAAPSGLIVYRGSLFPAWRTNLFAGGLAGQSLYRFTASGSRITGMERYWIGQRIRDVEQGPDGAIWLLTDGPSGKILKLTPR